MGAQERYLVGLMLDGEGEQKGLRDMPGVFIIGGADNDCREGLVSLAVEGVLCADVVSKLGADGIRTHIRKKDYFSANILAPLNMESCVRVSMCHYNSADEVKIFLRSMESLTAGA